jgi:hypothetical protein
VASLKRPFHTASDAEIKHGARDLPPPRAIRDYVVEQLDLAP